MAALARPVAAASPDDLEGGADEGALRPGGQPQPAAGVGVAAAQKSQAAFRTISEVAADLDVAQHVLRFWESKFPQVRPLKRGGGRRYYRPEDVDLLRQIRALLYDEGYTIKGAQKLLRARRGSTRPGAATIRGGTASVSPEPTLPAATTRRATPPATSAREPAEAGVRRELRELKAELVELRDLLRRARAG